jgi:hypothetical protein
MSSLGPETLILILLRGIISSTLAVFCVLLRQGSGLQMQMEQYELLFEGEVHDKWYRWHSHKLSYN